MEYMISNEIRHYDKDVEKQFLYHEFGNRGKRELSRHEKFRYYGARMLTQFQETGHIDGVASAPKILSVHS